MREWFMRLRDWLRRDVLDAELAEELRFHRERLERDALANGLTANEAAFAAKRRLGSPTRARESARDRWSIPSVDNVIQDTRYALRGLRRSPGFTAAVVLTLGLGIGANAAMFGAVSRLMFRAPNFLRDPSKVHRVYLQTTARGNVLTNTIFPITRYLDLKRWTRSFSQYAAFADLTLAIGNGDAAAEQPVAAVSASFFDFFDARPTLGRFFTPAEDSIPIPTWVVVLGHAYWQTEFGGKNVLGAMIQIGGARYTIIGVAPAGFSGVSEDRDPVAYVPLTAVAADNGGPSNANTILTTYRWDFTSMMVRVKRGVSLDEASADLSQAFARSRAKAGLTMPSVVGASIAHPRGLAGPLRTAAGPGAGLESQTLLWVTGVATIVLIIACANVTNLMVARVLRRRREIAMRLALGVGHWRLMSQLLTESMVLAALGCLAGTVVAAVANGTLRRLGVAGATVDTFLDFRTLTAAAGLAAVAGLVTAVGPALLAVRGDLAGTLRAGARGGVYQHSRIRTGLLIMQAALSVVLLVGAGLFVRSLDRVRSMRLGYDADQVLLAYTKFRSVMLDSTEVDAFQRRVHETAQRIPGVQAAALADARPFATSSVRLFVDGIDTVQKLGRFVFESTTPDYFKTMNTRIIRGRAFTTADRANTSLVSVVSESMARALWPGKDAIGQCIRVNADTMPCTTVIGIAEDAAYNGLIGDKRYTQYVPLAQGSGRGNKVLLRVSGNSAASVETVRRELQRVMPGDAYVTVQPLEDLVDARRRSWMIGATMFAAFGMLALVVAAVGLYGVIAYNVAQRMHELGVRVALGAQASNIARLVVGQGIAFAVSGVAIGLVIAFFAARWVQPLLFEQSARDPVTFAAVGLVIVLVALAASAVPAARAMRADPITALRSD